jgi:hypothetical protein
LAERSLRKGKVTCSNPVGGTHFFRLCYCDHSHPVMPPPAGAPPARRRLQQLITNTAASFRCRGRRHSLSSIGVQHWRFLCCRRGCKGRDGEPETRIVGSRHSLWPRPRPGHIGLPTDGMCEVCVEPHLMEAVEAVHCMTKLVPPI